MKKEGNKRKRTKEGNKRKRTEVDDLIAVLKHCSKLKEKEIEKKLTECIPTLNFITFMILAKVIATIAVRLQVNPDGGERRNER